MSDQIVFYAVDESFNGHRVTVVSTPCLRESENSYYTDGHFSAFHYAKRIDKSDPRISFSAEDALAKYAAKRRDQARLLREEADDCEVWAREAEKLLPKATA